VLLQTTMLQILLQEEVGEAVLQIRAAAAAGVVGELALW
jgi:hypothetical protein